MPVDHADAPTTIEAWREGYNTVRPNQALGYNTPAECAMLLAPDLEFASTPHLSPT